MIGQCVLLTIFYQEIKCADYSLHRVLLLKWACLMHKKDAVQPSEANHTHTLPRCVQGSSGTTHT